MVYGGGTLLVPPPIGGKYLKDWSYIANNNLHLGLLFTFHM